MGSRLSEEQLGMQKGKEERQAGQRAWDQTLQRNSLPAGCCLAAEEVVQIIRAGSHYLGTPWGQRTRARGLVTQASVYRSPLCQDGATAEACISFCPPFPFLPG